MNRQGDVCSYSCTMPDWLCHLDNVHNGLLHTTTCSQCDLPVTRYTQLTCWCEAADAVMQAADGIATVQQPAVERHQHSHCVMVRHLTYGQFRLPPSLCYLSRHLNDH